MGTDPRYAPESKVAIEEYEPLQTNLGRSFQGPIPAGSFYLDTGEAKALLAHPEAAYADVVRPYLNGDDSAEDQSSTHGGSSSTLAFVSLRRRSYIRRRWPSSASA
jgi:hypothetical protein